LIQSIGLFKFT